MGRKGQCWDNAVAESFFASVKGELIDTPAWAPDSLGYNEHIGAVAAIVSQHLEEALTQRFGLE